MALRNLRVHARNDDEACGAIKPDAALLLFRKLVNVCRIDVINVVTASSSIPMPKITIFCSYCSHFIWSSTAIPGRTAAVYSVAA